MLPYVNASPMSGTEKPGKRKAIGPAHMGGNPARGREQYHSRGEGKDIMAQAAAIYARFSSHNQREESIDDQVRVCRAQAASDGCPVVAVYADHAINGTTDRRPEFLRMVADAGRGRFDRLYVYKLDRFARNRFDSATYRAKLRKAGVDVVSASERVPDGPEGIMLESVLEGMAEYYSANLSQNIRRGMEGNAMQCRSNGARFYGYRSEGGRYVVDEDEAVVVRRAFREVAGGSTVSEVCRGLNADGIRTRRGKEWRVATMSKMLRSDRYIGTYAWGGTVVPGGMPAIVDEQTALRARDNMAKRGGFHRVGKHPYPLAGLLRSSSGRAIIGAGGTSATGRTYWYYRDMETGEHWPQDELEGAVYEAVAGALSESGVADIVADLVLGAQDDALAEEMDEGTLIRKRIASIKVEESNALDMAIKLGASDALAEKVRALGEERAQLEKRLGTLERSAPVFTREHVLFWLESVIASRDVVSLVAAFVSKIVIDDNSVRVEFPMVELPQADGSSTKFPLVEARRIELRSTKVP